MNREGELGIYEVYYSDDGTVKGYSAEPTSPGAETLEALRENCRLYLTALEKPILPYDID